MNNIPISPNSVSILYRDVPILNNNVPKWAVMLYPLIYLFCPIMYPFLTTILLFYPFRAILHNNVPILPIKPILSNNVYNSPKITPLSYNYVTILFNNVPISYNNIPFLPNF